MQHILEPCRYRIHMSYDQNMPRLKPTPFAYVIVALGQILHSLVVKDCPIQLCHFQCIIHIWRLKSYKNYINCMQTSKVNLICFLLHLIQQKYLLVHSWLWLMFSGGLAASGLHWYISAVCILYDEVNSFKSVIGIFTAVLWCLSSTCRFIIKTSRCIGRAEQRGSEVDWDGQTAWCRDSCNARHWCSAYCCASVGRT